MYTLRYTYDIFSWENGQAADQSWGVDNTDREMRLDLKETWQTDRTGFKNGEVESSTTSELPVLQCDRRCHLQKNSRLR